MYGSMLIALSLLSSLTGRYRRSDEEGEMPPRGDKGFTDITVESGVAGLVAQHYDKYPRWWLSGLHLVGLVGDGELDLFLSTYGRGDVLAALIDVSRHTAVTYRSNIGSRCGRSAGPAIAGRRAPRYA